MTREELIEAIIEGSVAPTAIGAGIGTLVGADLMSRGMTGKGLWSHGKVLRRTMKRRKKIRRKLRRELRQAKKAHKST